MFNLYRINLVEKIATLLVFVAMMGSCAKDDLYNDIVAEGTPVEAKFQFSMPEQDIVVSTRALGDATTKNIENLYILGFKGETKIFGFYYDKELAGGQTTTITSKEEVPAGTYQIYAIANINSDVYGVDKDTDNTNNAKNIKTFLDGVTTKEQLMNKALTILLSSRNLDRTGASMLMSGELCDDNGNPTTCTINANGQLVKTINLKRLDSEITFKFKGGSNVDFTAKRWYIVNAPARTYLMERDVDVTNGNVDDYYHTYKSKEEDLMPVYDNSFTYYMPENRKLANNASQMTSYHDREKEVDNSKNEHDVDPDTQRRNYVYAPNNGTYVVVSGHYEGPAKAQSSIGATGNVIAEVKYVIHLGYVGKKVEDFFSKRNVKYTYNVTVNGVDNIIVEVEDNIENETGATGDVIFGGSDNVYTLDSHYETVLLTFDYDELVTAYGDGKIEGLFTAVANTPYSNMIDGDAAKMDDQKWVQVIKNPDASTDFQIYHTVKDKLQSVQAMLDDLKLAVVNKDKSMFKFVNGKYIVNYTCFVDEFYYDKEDLPLGAYNKIMDKDNIWKSFVNNPNRTMYIICYRKKSVDQESSIVSSKYVISQRSIQTFYSTEPTPGQKIIAYGTESLNETGNLPFSYMYFRTYNADNGWLNFKLQAELNSRIGWQKLIEKDNGYKSLDKNRAVNKHGNLNPENYDGKGAESNYLRAMNKERSAINTEDMVFNSACLQRNRRESESNDLSLKEIKWYLPAINQYQAFYIGEAALSQESRLFDYPNVNPVNLSSFQFIKHYAASNLGSDYSAYLFWAEEATSVSTYSQQDEWSKQGGGSANNPEVLLLKIKRFGYRCMRNLGSDGIAENGEYDTYYSVSSENKEGRVEFEYEKLNPLVKSRGRVTGELGQHFYQDKGNHFYKNGFEVAEAALCNNLMTTLERATGVNTTEGTGCESLNENLPQGEAKWRVPNLRELTLMWQEQVINASQANADIGRATSRTQISYKYKDDVWYRKGWTVTNPRNGGANNIGMSSGANHQTTVRCVRDLR